MSGFSSKLVLLAGLFGTSGASVSVSHVVNHISSLSTVQAGSRLSALLQQVASATASSKSTPGVRAQVQSIVDEIDGPDGIVEKILEGQSQTQAKLTTAFSQWDTNNGVAVSAKEAASVAVGNTSTCVLAEKGILGDLVLETKVAECEARDAVKMVSFTEPLFPNGATTFQCDTEDESLPCSDEAVGTWGANVNTNLETMEGVIEAARSDWITKKNRCQTRDDFDAQHSECTTLKGSAATMVCTFGGAIAANCEDKKGYEAIKESANGSGNADSNADRKEEYSTAKLVACLAQSFLLNGDKLAEKLFLDNEAEACYTTIAADVTIVLTFGAEQSLAVFPCAGGPAGTTSSDWIEDTSGQVSVGSYTAGTEFQYPFADCE